MPQGGADGRVDAVLMSLQVADDAIQHVQGTLDYSGGTVTWGRNGAADVPPLQGRLSMEDQVPSLRSTQTPRANAWCRRGSMRAAFIWK